MQQSICKRYEFNDYRKYLIFVIKIREMSRVAVKAKRLVSLNSVIEYKDEDIV